jgi:hypothetical protein
VTKKALSPSSGHRSKVHGPVATINKQSMGYFVVKDIESATSYLKREWAGFAFKELLDNAYDWLNDHYPAIKPEDNRLRKITARLWLTENESNKFIHIAVRNSNVDNKPVFTNLEKTLDFDLWYSTKRGQHRITAGGLGDALKRILGMGYAAWIELENETKQKIGEEMIELEVEEKQWNEPIIVRCNRTERRAYLKVQMSRGRRWIDIETLSNPIRDIGTDTEVEITLPAAWIEAEEVQQMHQLTQYFERYKVPKLKTEFELQQGETE